MTDERDLNGVVLAGRYRVLEQIGVGGMGTVHAGEHIEVGRRVAIKILRPESSARPALVERFRREARVTARIEHENVVECLDVGVSDAGECFYVMEWLRGEDLQALLRRERTLAWPRVRAILAQVCRALAAAHERGVVHRDLKPGNVFLVQRGDNRDFVKLLDFGIAKLEDEGQSLTMTEAFVGTPAYVAPEAVAGQPSSSAGGIGSPHSSVKVASVGVTTTRQKCWPSQSTKQSPQPIWNSTGTDAAPGRASKVISSPGSVK